MKAPWASTAVFAFLIRCTLVVLFSTASFAEDSPSTTQSPQSPDADTATSQAASSAAPASTLSASSAPSPTPVSSTTHANPSITQTGPQSTVVSPSIPVITGGSSATKGGGLGSNAPKLPNTSPTHPAATVPPTSDAPFMQVSSLPEGTVFIAVGAFLGFAAFAVLLWRALTAWALHRSVKRAAMQQGVVDAKARFRTPSAPIYKYSDRESTMSLGTFAGTAGRSGKKNGRPSTAGHGATSSQSLFFSPTAGSGAGLSNPGNRGSGYLPAGYYTAGTSAPGGGAGITHIGSGSRENISLSTLRPQSQGYSRPHGLGPSPPDSPAFSAIHSVPGHGPNPSTSTLDLNRAPSAYLENLFDEVPPPGHGPGGRF